MSHRLNKKTGLMLIAAVVTAAPLSVLLADDDNATGIYKVRHDEYHKLGDAFKTIRDQSKTDAPDTAAIKSAAQVVGPRALGVVMTGMGEDGLRGARALASAGSRVIAEDPASCVVYGMPRAIIEAGLAHEIAMLEGIADVVLRHVGRQDS